MLYKYIELTISWTTQHFSKTFSHAQPTFYSFVFYSFHHSYHAYGHNMISKYKYFVPKSFNQYYKICDPKYVNFSFLLFCGGWWDAPPPILEQPPPLFEISGSATDQYKIENSESWILSIQIITILLTFIYVINDNTVLKTIYDRM